MKIIFILALLLTGCKENKPINTVIPPLKAEYYQYYDGYEQITLNRGLKDGNI